MNVSLGMVLEAREHLKGVVHRTDLVPSKVLSNDEYQVYLKSESLQDTGSFKVRGAYYKMTRLSEEEKQRGVIACSAGNHAQGVALAAQKNGIDLCAEDVYNELWKWLTERNCEKLVNGQLLEQYAMSVSRWIQCEQCISEYGFLAKHPTTGSAIASPYVMMSQSYMKQINQIWYQIYQVVKENCSVEYGGSTPHDDMMERLLNSRRNKG